VNPIRATHPAHLFYIGLRVLTTTKLARHNITEHTNLNRQLREVPLLRFILVFGRYSIRISAGTPAILAAIFCGFLRFLWIHTGIISRLDHDRYLQNPFQFIIHQPSDNSTLYNMFQCREYENSSCGCGCSNDSQHAVSLLIIIINIIQSINIFTHRSFRSHLLTYSLNRLETKHTWFEFHPVFMKHSVEFEILKALYNEPKIYGSWSI
jgi:hypothetical protein